MTRKRLFYRPLQARTPESAKKHFQGFFTDQHYFSPVGVGINRLSSHLMYNFPPFIMQVGDPSP